MNPIQLIQHSLGLVPDGIIGENTFKNLSCKWNLTNIQLAHFLGQCEHETGGFIAWEENLNYSNTRLLEIFPNYYKDPLLAIKHQRKPSVIANHVYGSRMGNVYPNDGYNFRGRGAIQLTGRSNYTSFSLSINKTLVITNPELVSSEYAFDAGIWFFKENKIFDFCIDLSEETILKVSRAVNLGNKNTNKIPHKLEDRKTKTLKYSNLYLK